MYLNLRIFISIFLLISNELPLFILFISFIIIIKDLNNLYYEFKLELFVILTLYPNLFQWFNLGLRILLYVFFILNNDIISFYTFESILENYLDLYRIFMSPRIGTCDWSILIWNRRMGIHLRGGGSGPEEPSHPVLASGEIDQNPNDKDSLINRKKKYNCILCHKSFTTITDLDRHGKSLHN
uniref:C2H2-type domain-containing protein n=1 Tax=Dactylella sp. TaxID=1814903 RepID=A0A482DVL6_9PEZI|nr:hypothetical protein [Dactylella sp.]